MDEWYTYQRLFSCFVIVFHSMFNILFQFYIYHIQMIVLLNQVNWSEINRQETKQGCWVCVFFYGYRFCICFVDIPIGFWKGPYKFEQLSSLCKIARSSVILFSLNIFDLLKYAKRIRHKLNKLMKSSPTYNKLQHYLIEHACIWIFLTLICVNWRRTENEERN
jgi:fumarate reductase subunit D